MDAIERKEIIEAIKKAYEDMRHAKLWIWLRI